MCVVVPHPLGKGTRCAPPLHPLRPLARLRAKAHHLANGHVSPFHHSQRRLRFSPAPHRLGRAFLPPRPQTISWRPTLRSFGCTYGNCDSRSLWLILAGQSHTNIAFPKLSSQTKTEDSRRRVLEQHEPLLRQSHYHSFCLRDISRNRAYRPKLVYLP